METIFSVVWSTVRWADGSETGGRWVVVNQYGDRVAHTLNLEQACLCAARYMEMYEA